MVCFALCHLSEALGKVLNFLPSTAFAEYEVGSDQTMG
jgi:hypothetical protein